MEKFGQQPLQWNNIVAVRDRLIIVLRILGLYRSVDLANMHRKVSMVNDRPFIWVKRKGWQQHRWAELIVLDTPSLSPWLFYNIMLLLLHMCPKVLQCSEPFLFLTCHCQPTDLHLLPKTFSLHSVFLQHSGQHILPVERGYNFINL